MYTKRVQWTHFSCLVHPIHLTRSRGTELEIEPTGLDFRKWSPALHVLSWVPAGGPVCSMSVSLSQIEHFLAPIHFESSSQFNSFQHSTSLWVHYTTEDRALSSLHSSHTNFKYIASFFLLRKNLEHIRIMFYFFCLCKYCD